VLIARVLREYVGERKLRRFGRPGEHADRSLHELDDRLHTRGSTRCARAQHADETIVLDDEGDADVADPECLEGLREEPASAFYVRRRRRLA